MAITKTNSNMISDLDAGSTYATTASVPTNNNQLTNGANYITDSDVASNSAVTANTAKVGLTDNSITPARISSTDTLLNVNDTHQTIGLGILANSSSSTPKVNMDGGVRVGNQVPTVAGELEVTGNGASNILVVENTSTTATDSSIISCRGPQVTIQMKDTQAPTDQGTYNITCDGGYIQINLISDNGLTTTGLMKLDSSGNLSLKGTLSENQTL